MLQAEKDRVDRAVAAVTVPAPLNEAFASAARGGKRYRGILAMEVCRHLGGSEATADAVAASVELLHASSLVVDDLPAFDNDAERRGEPSVWKAHGERRALMAAGALVGKAVELVGSTSPSVRPEAMQPMLSAVGDVLTEASDGQQRECEGESSVDVARAKTAPFFEAAMVLGWCAGGGDLKDLPIARRAARSLGTAFQLVDDLIDYETDDRSAAKTLGRDKAAFEAWKHLHNAERSLLSIRLWTHPIRELFARIGRHCDFTPTNILRVIDGEAQPARDARGQSPR